MLKKCSLVGIGILFILSFMGCQRDVAYKPNEQLPIDENGCFEGSFINVDGELYAIGSLEEKTIERIEAKISGEEVKVTLPSGMGYWTFRNKSKLSFSYMKYSFGNPEERERPLGCYDIHNEFRITVPEDVDELEFVLQKPGEEDETPKTILLKLKR
ncbi:MAG: hypothetical protein Q4Q17_00010 [Tissierellia bacterium]|nr:hypothetical protein [Tissierellia bacterium]